MKLCLIYPDRSKRDGSFCFRYVHNNPVKAKIVKSPENYIWSSYTEYINENIIIRYQQKRCILGYFSNNQDQFAEFHRQIDDNEYLDIKEDIEKESLDRGQEIIETYFREKGLRERRQVIKNQVYLYELIQNLIKDSRLTHRQIANILEISNSAVQKVSLKREGKKQKEPSLLLYTLVMLAPSPLIFSSIFM